MTTVFKSLSGFLVLLLATGPLTVTALAQDAPAAAPAGAAAKSSAQIDAGDPRANTSAPTAETPAGGSAPSAASGSTASPPASAVGTAARSASRAAAARSAATPAAKTGTDRLDLGTATVTGDREQPKVMYIVPWKRSDIGDGSGKPMNSLLDEALAPVDRDEFKREVVYYNAINADVPQNGASTPAAKPR